MDCAIVKFKTFFNKHEWGICSKQVWNNPSCWVLVPDTMKEVCKIVPSSPLGWKRRENIYNFNFFLHFHLSPLLQSFLTPHCIYIPFLWLIPIIPQTPHFWIEIYDFITSLNLHIHFPLSLLGSLTHIHIVLLSHINP